MIKFLASGRGRRLIGMGITDRNIKLLKEGHPIKTRLEILGFESVDLVIFYGGTDPEMIKMVEEKLGIKITEIKEEKETKNARKQRKSPLN